MFRDEFITDEVRELLRSPTFDNWRWSCAESIILTRQMFIDLDLLTKCHIDVCINSYLLTLTYLTRNFLITSVKKFLRQTMGDFTF